MVWLLIDSIGKFFYVTVPSVIEAFFAYPHLFYVVTIPLLLAYNFFLGSITVFFMLTGFLVGYFLGHAFWLIVAGWAVGIVVSMFVDRGNSYSIKGH